MTGGLGDDEVLGELEKPNDAQGAGEVGDSSGVGEADDDVGY